MALSPEIQGLIDTLHTTPREEGWGQSVLEQYQAALDSIQTPGIEAVPEHIIMMKNDVLQEILRQHVDEDILPDVMQVFDNPPREEFVETLEEKASAWPEALQVYTEEEFEAGGPRLNQYAEQTDPASAEQMAAAARAGNSDATLQMILLLNELGRERTYIPAGNAPGEDVPGSMTANGRTLFDYVKDVIYRGNAELGDRTNAELFFDPDDAGGQYRPGVLITMTPQEMRKAVQDAIFLDIENGTFPIQGLDSTDAARIANALYDQAFTDAERTGVDVGGSVEGSIVNYSFMVSDAALSRAIDGLFLGENPVMESTAQSLMNEHRFAEIYEDVRSIWGEGLTADHLIEHFSNMMAEDRVDPRTGEMIRQQLDIPDHMQEAFLGAIYDAYRASRFEDPSDPESRRKPLDSAEFGRVMEERFGIIDPEHVVAPMDREGLDYGEAISVTLGEETPNGFTVVNEAGEVMFEIDLSEGFDIYAARAEGDTLVMDNMRGVETKEQLRELLGGEGFTIHAVSPLDEGLEGADNGISGYFIHAPGSGNSFHVGFDAIPESSVTPEFREVRNDGFDRRDQAPDLEVAPDFVIGEGGRPTTAEMGVTREPPPVGAPGGGPS